MSIDPHEYIIIGTVDPRKGKPQDFPNLVGKIDNPSFVVAGW